MRSAIQLNAREAKLKRAIRKQLKSLGFTKDAQGRLVPPDLSKDAYRSLHAPHKVQKLEKNAKFLRDRSKDLIQHFAEGHEVEPSKVNAKLELVRPGTEAAELFRFGSLYWSIPVSDGYGRRLRFLVRDTQNNKLIGIIGLGDPVFNLRVRDKLIGWSAKQRARRLVNVLDAFVLGAFPPYSMLLGGKLIASLVRSKEVVEAFRRKYSNARGIISKKRKKPKLLIVTTTSALGRSSVYNRLRLGDTRYFESIGFTEGWGHFHIPDSLFEEMRGYLRARKDRYSRNNRFGQGPNWRFRAIRQTLELLGLGGNSIHHGLKREVFVCKLADNAYEILRGQHKRRQCKSLLSASEVSALAVARWLTPRAQRYLDYLHWTRAKFLGAVSSGASEEPKSLCVTNVSSARSKD